jgi:hypothetical protein
MIKTAGTTINYILRNNFGYNYVEIALPTFRSDDLKNLLKINSNIRAIGGHSLRSTINLKSVCPKIKYLIFLRDPINRYISHYNHARRINSHQMTLEESSMILGETNYQTKFITGSIGIRDRSFCATKNDLRKAKKILSEDFTFVGLVEKFDQSLLLLRKMLGMQNFDIRYKKINITKGRLISKDMISTNLLNRLKEMNQLDCELYKFVKNELLKAHELRYGPDLFGDLNNFKIANKKYKFRAAQLLKFRIGKYLIYRKMSQR